MLAQAEPRPAGALLVLVHLRKGEIFAGLAAGFGVGTTTAWRYVQETVTLLAARAPRLDAALQAAKQAKCAFVGWMGSSSRSTASPPTGRSTPVSTAGMG